MTKRSVETFLTNRPLLAQLGDRGIELDQKLAQALEATACRPDIEPEDCGFPDSYLTLALYRLNTVLTRIVDLDDQRLNLFHEYKLAADARCSPGEVVPGRRLCRVIERAVQSMGDSRTLGVGHFLRAVVDLSVSEPAEDLEWLGFPGQISHNTFSVETLLIGLGYSAWTPLADVPELETILGSLQTHEPVEDVGYVLTTAGDRLVLRPASTLGAFSMANPAGSVERFATLSNIRSQFGTVTPSEILELEELINDPKASEAELQRFFTTNPHFFRSWDYRDIYPHVRLQRDDAGELIPDFLLVDPALHQALIVELKLPSARLVRHQRNRDRFTSAFHEAKAQLLEYRRWFDDKANRARAKEQFGLDIYAPKMAVLIGSNREFRDAVERQTLASTEPDIEIVTYDDLVERASRRLALIDRARADP